LVLLVRLVLVLPELRLVPEVHSLRMVLRIQCLQCYPRGPEVPGCPSDPWVLTRR